MILDKNAQFRLEYSQEAKHRVIIALNWDPRDDNVSLGERLQAKRGENISTYDLDLACVVFNENKEPIDGVSGRDSESVDNSGCIYHSGDDMDGIGDDDDEFISIEFRDIPDEIFHIVFVVEIQSAHNFDDVPFPFVRVADPFANKEQINIPLQGPEAMGKNAFVFARLYRHHDTWMVHYIGEYLNGDEVEDWVEKLQSYVYPAS